ncbi:hypothetical protein BBBOND_0204450 [Babesia bigemina]|uniref:Uncharacterized protein n=1 Tax=Babesia bigemina TaxID=5866 RepID=A0A061D5I4_BABBI|nr:hypothetical protein BBBOND_0204450 [Babesia bigemina]CDR95287.1 hypothetical protein BBBOND_0204450 [Babesia bigemina]|eukprot:XP_012767473.1 hypothetical protein BBBOND_0204450 [Babesia bigemina]
MTAPTPGGSVLIAISPVEDSLDVQMLHEALVPLGGAVVTDPEIDLQPNLLRREVLAKIPAGSNPAVLSEYSVRKIDVSCKNTRVTATSASAEDHDSNASIRGGVHSSVSAVESPGSEGLIHDNDVKATLSENGHIESHIAPIEMTHSPPKLTAADGQMSYVEPVKPEPAADVATSPTTKAEPSNNEGANVACEWIPALKRELERVKRLKPLPGDTTVKHCSPQDLICFVLYAALLAALYPLFF